jgi:hypothetical protein
MRKRCAPRLVSDNGHRHRQENRLATHERLRLLLCWGYHRSGWIEPFEQLRDRFDIRYLFHRRPEDEEGCQTDAPRHYWADFPRAQAVLDELQPDRIVFMALDGAWSIALNAAARRRGVPTLIVQHGHLESEGSGERRTAAAALAQGSPVPALRFAASSFGLRDARSTFRLLSFMSDARRNGPRAAMPRHRFDARMPDRYIALSPESALAHQRLDGADPDQVRCVGLPEYDQIFRSVPTEAPSDGSVLLLDSPNAENRWGVTTLSVPEKIEFLESLSSTATALGRQLRIKLHPETYRAEWLPALPDVVYLRDVDLTNELSAAAMCVGFDSTLVIPAVWFRPTVLIGLRAARIGDLAHDLEAAVVLRSVDLGREHFEEAQRLFERSLPQRREFVRRLAYQSDGRAVERLGEALAAPTAQQAED